jgi:hypothetical protein
MGAPHPTPQNLNHLSPTKAKEGRKEGRKAGRQAGRQVDWKKESQEGKWGKPEQGAVVVAAAVAVAVAVEVKA